MRRPDNPPALTEEVARFQAEVRRLAFDAVRAILRQELDRKLAKLQPARRGKPGRASTAVPPAASAHEPPAAASPHEPPAAASPHEPPAASPHEPLAAANPHEPPTAPPAGKRGPWTREAIISELAGWISSGTAIDAAFVTRYGPPGLVAAARRIFGRFEAALNVAGLHASKLSPDGPMPGVFAAARGSAARLGVPAGARARRRAS